MFDEFLKVACIFGLPLLLVIFLIGGWASIIPMLILIGVLSSAFGSSKGLAQADQTRKRRDRQRSGRR